ncbi:glycosyltransferase [Terribacillus saccharophilus]|uniref:glycosyltransferase n=1 Tax=Terribacillus saccharophilus TaxID=361277 RepID=UPI000BA76839|nr:glycosyltransferase [Terribacillus saccharophilus]PAF18065.1 hypothetical protein CHH51_09470 [Terribacillus saccharophilus]
MLIDIVLGYAEGKGGLEDVLTTVVNGLVSKGHRIRVLQTHAPKFESWADTIPEIYYYGQEGKVEEETVSSMQTGYTNFLKSAELPDVIIATHAPILSYICRTAIARFKPDTPVVSWLHGPPAYFGGGQFLKYSDAHFAISSSIGRTIKDIAEEQPIYLINNPIDIKQNKIIRPNVLKVIFIGRLSNREKRLDLLLRALVNVQGEWSLTCIGDGPDKNMLYNLADELHINKKITWLGWKESPWDEIDEASVLVLPSDVEGFGLVLVEALSRGVAVISTDCDGPMDIVKDGINGWIVPKGDFNKIKDILNAIQSGIIKLPDEQQCVNSVLEYEAERVLDKMNDILNELKTDGFILNEKVVNESQIDDIITCKFITDDIYPELVEKLSGERAFKLYDMKIDVINYSYTRAIVRFSYQKDSHDSIKEVRVKIVNENGTWQVKRIF